jgi:hypothetical protein
VIAVRTDLAETLMALGKYGEAQSELRVVLGAAKPQSEAGRRAESLRAAIPRRR